jgi:two-component system sensor histidine kinase KdpD
MVILTYDFYDTDIGISQPGQIMFMTDSRSADNDRLSGVIVTLDQERERIHRQMLSSVSHDLKTPLASIIGSLEAYQKVKEKLPPEKLLQLITIALQEAHQLDGFISNILDMAKLENQLVKPQKDEIEVGNLIRQTITRLSARLDHAKITVMAQNGALRILSDATLLGRVVGLVLDNAAKYGGPNPAVTIRYGKNEAQAWIEIQDDGKGIPEKNLELIFSKYTRFEKLDHHGVGTGLGLAISREIMALLGGTITAANLGYGALFTLRLPVK